MPNEVVLIAMQGDLESASWPEACDRVLEHRSSRIVLNVKACRYMDVDGFAALIKSLSRVRESGGEMVISQPTRFLRRSLEVLGLLELFKLFERDEDALDYFGGEDGAAGVTARLIPVKPHGSAEAKPPEGDEH